MKKIWLVPLAVLVLVSVCSCEKKPAGNADQVDTTDDAVKIEASEPKETGAFYYADDECYAIDTPYCKLYYPIEWQDITKVEIKESEKACSVSFSAVLDTTTVPLYAIVFGESETGYPIAELPVDNGWVSVYCEDRTKGVTDTLTAESADIYLRMSEDINVIIYNLMSN